MYDSDSETKPNEFVLGQIDRLLLAFPRFKMDEGNIDAYVSALAEIPSGKLEAAIGRAINTSKFFPPIAEIIKAAEHPEGTPDEEKRKRTRIHISMCQGMNEMEIHRYFTANRIDTGTIDMNYFRASLEKNGREREAYLREQWPNR